MTAAQDYVDDARRRARRAADPARAVLRRARPRPAGDLDRARAGAAGRRRAAARARDDPRRRRAARPRRLARAEAVAGERRQRRARPLLALGERTAATASTTRPRPTGSRAEARSFIAGVLAHLPGLCGLTAPSFNSYHRIVPAVLGRRVRLLGPRQPRGAGARAVALPRGGGGVDERRAEGRATRAATRTWRSAG